MSTEIQVDDETRAALLLFNERVEASAARERGKKRIAKAARAKDEATAVVRKVGSDSNASKESKEEAEAAYKDAVEHLRLVEVNPDEPPKSKKAAETPEADPIEAAAEPETKSDDEAAAEPETKSEDEPEPETSADDEPEAKSDDEAAAEPEPDTSADNESTEEESSETPATAS